MGQTVSSYIPYPAESASHMSAAESAFPSSSSSSSTNLQSCYDVFLSFRGTDTRRGVVAELYEQLNNKRGVKTFKDETSLEIGDVISSTLLEAIERSKYAIVVLSEHYADSVWCLEELEKICQCMQENRILPLFYRVEPSDVRYQKKSFEIAFQRHEESRRHTKEKVKQWRDALNKVGNISGWHTQNYKSDRELVNAIVEYVCRKVVPASVLSTGDFHVFEATRVAMDKVMNALKDDNVTVIAVHGIGGVGKTSLVEHAGQEARNHGLFDHVIKIVVSQTLDLRKVQGTLADCLGITLKQDSEFGRASRLNKEIIIKRKLLIIVDDVWERLELASIGIPSYEELQNCSSKVIFTTRIWNVCHVMCCHEKVTLNVLSQEDSWALFVKNARRSFEPMDFEEVAKKVARECGGLPIALIAVARALGDKEIGEWNTAARRLEKSQKANPDDKGVAFESIKLSYDYLRDKECKACFLLLCLFPEDTSIIKIEQMFRYAIGKGLFGDADTIEEARGRTISVVNTLINSSLLMNTRHSAYIQMHDVIRDTAIQIAESEEGFLVKAGHYLRDWPRLHGDYYTISLMRNKICKLPRRLVLPKLQILLLSGSFVINEIPERFFESLPELRVLDLSWTRISKLPQSLSLLTNIQVFVLDGCPQIINISIVTELEKLEILSMRSYAVKQLFTDMRDLTSLRMLDLTRGHMSTFPTGVLSKFQNLEELYISGFQEWGSKMKGRGGKTNASFEEVTSLSRLRVLEARLSSVDQLPKIAGLNPNWIVFNLCIESDKRPMFNGNDQNSMVLTLDGTMSTLPSWFLNVVMNRADRLELFLPQGRLIDMFLDYDHRRLQRLKYLSVRGDLCRLPNMKNTIPTLWFSKEPAFKNLEELHLNFLDCGFWVTTLLPESLVNLKSFEISHCTNWGNLLLPSNLLQKLPYLREVKCCLVDNIRNVFSFEGLPEPKPSNLSHLQLYDLAALRSICDGPAPPAMFQSLKSLLLHQCNLQGSLFSNDAAQYLCELEDISIDSCPLLERIIEAGNKQVILPKLKNLTLKSLPKLYCNSDVDIDCPSLVHLYVERCPQISMSFSDFHSRKPFELVNQIDARVHNGNIFNELVHSSHEREFTI